MSLDDLAELLPRVVVPLVVQLGLAELIELLRRKDRRGRRLEQSAAARDEQQADQEDARALDDTLASKLAHTYSTLQREKPCVPCQPFRSKMYTPNEAQAADRPRLPDRPGDAHIRWLRLVQGNHLRVHR